MKYSKYSVIVIGSGAAGLFLALKIASEKHLKDGVLVVTKSSLTTSNTELAQGGIVAVLPEFNKADSVSLHVSDTIKAGCGLNDFNAVKFISQNSSTVIQELINLGVEFDKTPDGKLSFALEAAHSVPRILHVKDKTGEAIEHQLAKCVSNSDEIDVYEHTVAVEILCDKTNAARGVVVYNSKTNSYEAVYSNAVVLATGGVGQLFAHTTNPAVTVGDGIALAFRAGAQVKNMEFVQFHPTALFVEGKESMPLVSEAVRGAGAKLCDANGVYFAKKYDERGELAPRDVVARAIFNEMKETGAKNVFLDISQMGIEFFRTRFPNITRLCAENNIDITTGLIPVAPAAHYFMGGVDVDVVGETSIENLYAIGEVANTGLHGANRLASNSLLECVVCAWQLALELSDTNLDAPKNFDEKIKSALEKYENDFEYQADVDELCTEEFKRNLKNIMWNGAGIVRSQDLLLGAKSNLRMLSEILSKTQCQKPQDKFELQNMLLVANLIVNSALERKNSIGGHYRQDYPNLSQEKEETKYTIQKAELKNGEVFAE